MLMCGSLFKSMIGFHGVEAIPDLLTVIGGMKAAIILFGLLVVVFFAPNLWQINFRPSLPLAVSTAAIFVVCVLRFDAQSPFLYFQF